jgi:hypothetical protein
MPGRRSVRGSFEPRSEGAGGRSVAPAAQRLVLSDPDAARRNTRMRFEQWAQNPLCQANTVSAVYAVRMSEVAVAEGYRPTFGQSPFAIARGDQFERSLFYRRRSSRTCQASRTSLSGWSASHRDPHHAADRADLRPRVSTSGEQAWRVRCSTTAWIATSPPPATPQTAPAPSRTPLTTLLGMIAADRL